ncbi:MAG TPA: hypothetical protein VLF67_04700 [Candidatus Saccharimonas sp.]|nr:hypothetical protein [Candidatus Saccharimonas sp.]
MDLTNPWRLAAVLVVVSAVVLYCAVSWPDRWRRIPGSRWKLARMLGIDLVFTALASAMILGICAVVGLFVHAMPMSQVVELVFAGCVLLLGAARVANLAASIMKVGLTKSADLIPHAVTMFAAILWLVPTVF